MKLNKKQLERKLGDVMEHLEILKITWVNYWLIKIGVKTLELRAYEKVKNGGSFWLATPKGKPLGVIVLKFISQHGFWEKSFSAEPSLQYFKEDRHYNYVANTWFWKRWVSYYLDRKQTPAFYQIIAYEDLK